MVVSGVSLEEVIEFHVIDLVGGFGLKSLVDDDEFLVSDVELEEVEDGSEPCVSDESRVRLVFVLEVRLDEESSVLGLKSNSLQASFKLLFLGGSENIEWVKD